MVGEKNCLDKSGGGGNGQFIILQGTISINVLGALYWKLTMVLKDTSFGEKLKHLSVRREEFHYTEMLVRRHIY